MRPFSCVCFNVFPSLCFLKAISPFKPGLCWRMLSSPVAVVCTPSQNCVADWYFPEEPRDSLRAFPLRMASFIHWAISLADHPKAAISEFQVVRVGRVLSILQLIYRVSSHKANDLGSKDVDMVLQYGIIGKVNPTSPPANAISLRRENNNKLLKIVIET